MAYTYTVKYTCINCGKDSRITFPIGTKAPSITQCPNCGVGSANKVL